MSMEISGILGHASQSRPDAGEERARRVPTLSEQAAQREAQKTSPDTGSLESVLDEIQQVTSALNRRLKFSINRDLGQVVVKVIDRATDKVIKELPPEEIQRLHVRLREAIGLFIDEEI